ncbi:hypothetical protein ASC66_12330 [Leifsonia sp. Root4]|uniref:hypothetical protein n=1 Tax=Leifsonia sp. Root4 TaxID=1736525 RepID=UPI0006FC4388|nr:hypothetical protein [Leifsonia sp. Root4]KQW05743.1 hypothetical protein ASC66_12330 [Leifsonia sp. Root4]
MSLKNVRIGCAGLLVLALAGCASGGAEQTAAESTPTATSTPESVSTAAPSTQLTDEELAAVFTELQFVPAQYADAGELLDSIYPGLVASDLSCLTPFGVGWDAAQPDAAQEFGASNDRSMTAVVSSVGDDELASELISESADALSRCAQGSDLFTMQGQPVQTQVETFDAELTGADETVAFRVTGDVGGSAFTLVGMTARVGGNVVALVGWDPATNEAYVPAATQMFVDAL